MSIAQAVREDEARRDEPPRPEHLEPAYFVDSDDPVVVAFAEEHTAGATTDAERVSRLFDAVRDGIRYDPYVMNPSPDAYRASTVLQTEATYCIPKAVAFTAVCRAAGVPARLGFADVRNHLSTERLTEMMDGSDLFIFHGYAEAWVDGAWRKATPAFNAELCRRFGVEPLAFDGSEDALLHEFSGDGSQYMEYVLERGVYPDLPHQEIMDTLKANYPTLWGKIDAGAAEQVADPMFRDA